MKNTVGLTQLIRTPSLDQRLEYIRSFLCGELEITDDRMLISECYSVSQHCSFEYASALQEPNKKS